MEGIYAVACTSRWWQGPEFLQFAEDRWSDGDFVKLENDIPEQKRVVTAVATFDHCLIIELLSRISSLNTICRVVAYCLQFLKVNRPDSLTRFISHNEVTRALEMNCRVVQKCTFVDEYKALSGGKSINPARWLLSLSPFMDERSLIRVGGRLKNSNVPYNARHPILLSRSNDLVKRIIEYEHGRNLYADTQATMAAVRQRFLPLSLRSTTRKILLKCIVCFQAKPTQSETIMGSLLASRTTISKPVSQCGVDYAGPLLLNETKRCNARSFKAYISIFVCFVTKAVHIEIGSDLTSEAFVAVLKRFISRKGKPAHIYSDNGTTCVGTKRHIEEVFQFLNNQKMIKDIKEFLRNQETSWTFIPPNAPHFGGLWEAAVKSVKHYLTRIVGKANFTFKEMSTTLCEIEAILNSRPFMALSEDPNDLSYISPGHFLLGTAMNDFPCCDLHDINENRLTRWYRVEQIRQHFWRRWSSEYLNSL
ncbi:hypothetical protein X777_12846 [Ooceraea biroi]|uniref:Integrase catalytic domain-containing protein n=1 Tax=Ooceraea biroi TaxID=2015173 RepID=A0A026VZ94_OOCBI|nr:hypothetical protein X777_12846 [Ooceraea biroi]